MHQSFSIFAVIMLLLFKVVTFAQEGGSLHSKMDTAEIKNLINTGSLVRKTNADSALPLFREALYISRKNRDDKGIAISLLNIGASLLDKHELYRSKQVFYVAAPYCQKVATANPKLLALWYNNLAAINTQQSNADSAVYFYELALSEMKKRNIKDMPLLMTIYANMGTALSLLQQSDQSTRGLYYINKSLELALQLKDTNILAQNYINTGLIYDRALHSSDSAQHYYRMALMLDKARGRKTAIANIFYYIGISWGKKGNLRMAKTYFDSAMQADKIYAAKNGGLLNALGEYYLLSRNYSKAISFFLKSLENNKQEGVTGDLLENYYHLSLGYHALGKNRAAYTYQKLYNDLRDSILNEEKIHSVNRMEVKYRTTEKDKELIQKQLLITRQQSSLRLQYLLLSGSLLLILILIGYVRHRKHKAILIALQAKLMGEEEERKRMAQELHDGVVSELSAVKMNFNALTPYADNKDAEHFDNILAQLEESISELRNTAHNLQPAILRREGLNAALQNLCTKITATKKLDIDLEFIGELPQLLPEVQLNIYRVVQELLQNILKHSRATHALVQVTVQPAKLSIIIDNNGTDIITEQSKGKDGIGVYNLRDRISFLRGIMEIESSSIYLEFPLKKWTARKK